MSDAATQTDRDPLESHPRPRTSGQPSRGARVDAATTTQRWAIGVLAAATMLLLAYVALLVATMWVFASGWNALGAGEPASVGLLGIGADLAPALLVGWCTGLAASAALARGETLGARTAGVTAGAVGAATGAALLALTGLL